MPEEPLVLLLQALTVDSLGSLRPLGYAVFDVAPGGATQYGSFELDL